MSTVDALTRDRRSASWHLDADRRRTTLIAGLCLLGSVAAIAAVIALPFVPAILLVCVLTLILVIRQPLIGLYVIFGLNALFESQARFDNLMLPGRLLHNGLSGTVGLTGVLLSPLELLLLLMFGSWLAQGLIRHRLDARGGRLLWPMLLFLGACGFGLVRGAISGGSLYIAFWEFRALGAFFICSVLAASTVRTRQHVQVLFGILLVGSGLFAIEGAYRHFTLIGVDQIDSDLVWEHEDAVLLGVAILQVLIQQIFGGPRWLRILGLLFCPTMVFVLFASQRRAGLIGMLIAFMAIGLVLLVAHRKAFCLVVLPLVVTGMVYLPLFWNNTGVIGQPARALRSIVQPDDRDAASNGYRDLEKINVRATILASPLLGVGFGREYLFVVPMPTISNWAFLHYEPHHNIHWIWLKTGAVGFILFWLFVGSAIALAAHFTRVLRTSQTRTFALTALAAIISSLVYCYVDTGLVATRLTVFLGIIVGTLSVLGKIDDSPEPAGHPRRVLG